MNLVALIGRITRDTEARTTAGGTSVCKFTIAVQRKFKNQDGNYEADFINCVAFGKTSTFIETYFNKGDMISVVGSIQTGSYEKDGRRIYTTDVIVNEAGFVGSKKESPSDMEDDEIPSNFEEVDDMDSLPF